MNTCTRKRCNYCCENMVVPLLEEDIERIVRLGFPDTAFYQVEGPLKRLLRIRNRCVFQDDDWGCAIHPFHPTRCKFYPLMYDYKTGEVVIDEHCKYREEFKVTPELARHQKAYVSWLAQETGERERKRVRMVRKMK